MVAQPTKSIPVGNFIGALGLTLERSCLLAGMHAKDIAEDALGSTSDGFPDVMKDLPLIG